MRAGSGYADGARFIEFAALTDPGLVPQAVATALSIREQPGQAVGDTLVARLRGRHLLLVLDNCEHLVHAVARLADRLLGSCANLAVLVTSQVILAIAGERVWPVPPLFVPDPPVADDVLAASEAVTLFCARAAATSPGFAARGESLGTVAEICRRLDGIPLAIELAAARTSMLSLSELAARLDARFTLLTGGSRAVLPRHQTLQTALDWSHNLLSPAEQALLRRLAVFAGGFSLEAAEAVCADAALPAVFDALAGLVAKSLVLADTGRVQSRYRMLETVRLYAAEQLARSGEGIRVRADHAHWCVDLAERAEPALTGPDQVAWLERLDMEQDNLRLALDWGLSERRGELCLRLAAAEALFWRIRGMFREGRERLAAALALGADQPAHLRARALWGAGFMALMLDDLVSSKQALDESLLLAEQIGDRRGQARALLLLGNGYPVNAIRLLERSVALSREAGDDWCLAHALAMLGRVHLDDGDVDLARPVLEECLAVARRTRDPQSLRIGLGILGELALGQGQYQVAEALLTEGLATGRELGEPFTIAFMMCLLGGLAAGRGDYEDARERLEAALHIHREGGVGRTIADTLCSLARVERLGGDCATAEALYSQAMGMMAEAGTRSSEVRLGLGELAIAAGDLQQARAHLEAALEPAQGRGNRRSVAAVTAGLARLARAEGDLLRSASLHCEALDLYRQVGALPSVAHGLEELAGLASRLAAPERAARLFGAAESLRASHGYARPPVWQSGYDGDVGAARDALGGARLDELRAEGSRTSVAEAVLYALRGWGPRLRGVDGWAGLSRAEWEVVNLVREGLTNAEIGHRLFISPRTVESHLTHVFAKLGIRSRRGLARGLASRDGPE